MRRGRIRVEGLCKDYTRYAAGYSGVARWKNFRRMLARCAKREKLHALRDVSFKVGPSEMLGVIGANGAGKSTLLRLLGGIGRPTCGEIDLVGRIGALLDLGGGFLGDLTGEENAVLAGVVAGLTRNEVRSRLEEIAHFAELEDFMREPLRTYSSGMAMRLAFSVAIHTDPEVLLIDEFLSVGDLSFQSKCIARIKRLREEGCAIVFVSHGMDQVRQLCDRALWLSKGRVAALDSARAVTTAFESEMNAETLRRTPKDRPATKVGNHVLQMHETRFGSLEAEIIGVDVRPDVLRSGGSLEVNLRYLARNSVNAPIVVVSITREDGTLCLDTCTESARVDVPDLQGEGGIRFKIERLQLGAGSYFVNVGLFENRWSHAFDYHFQVYQLVITGGEAHRGVIAPECHWELW